MKIAVHRKREGLDAEPLREDGGAEVPAVFGGQLDKRVSAFAGSHHDRLLAHRSPVRSPVGDVGSEQPFHLG